MGDTEIMARAQGPGWVTVHQFHVLTDASKWQLWLLTNQSKVVLWIQHKHEPCFLCLTVVRKPARLSDDLWLFEQIPRLHRSRPRSSGLKRKEKYQKFGWMHKVFIFWTRHIYNFPFNPKKKKPNPTDVFTVTRSFQSWCITYIYIYTDYRYCTSESTAMRAEKKSKFYLLVIQSIQFFCFHLNKLRWITARNQRTPSSQTTSYFSQILQTVIYRIFKALAGSK